MTNTVELERRGTTAIVTLNRPEARNALSVELLSRLHETFQGLSEDTGVQTVILTGAGSAFSAGVDLEELASRGINIDEGLVAIRAIRNLDKPVIGAINGPAVTGGLELALACDFRIGSERARFADTHARVGVVPGWGLTVRLSEVVGMAFAKQMSATGNYVDAKKALRTGLVNEVVGHDELLSCTIALAEDIASADTPVLRTIFRIYDDIDAGTSEAALAIEEREHRRTNASFDPRVVAERREAITARGRLQQH